MILVDSCGHCSGGFYCFFSVPKYLLSPLVAGVLWVDGADKEGWSGEVGLGDVGDESSFAVR